MTFEYRAVVTDEIPGVETVVVRTWLGKPGEAKGDERAFLLPSDYKLNEDNPLDLIVAAVDQNRQKLAEEKAAPKKRAPRKKAT